MQPFLPMKPLFRIEEDLLDRKSFLDFAINGICSVRTPFVFGLYGDWGSGKSTVVNFLMHLLRKQSGLIPIYYNAWKYDNELNALYPLLHTIRKTFIEHTPTHADDEDLKNKFMNAAYSSAIGLGDWGVRILSKSLTGESLKLDDLRKEWNNHESILDEWVNKVGQFEEAFYDLLNSYSLSYSQVNSIDEEDVRFVIFIDELDRCIPEKAIAILENIKNFLSIDKVVFVVSINPDVVGKALRHKYKGEDVDGIEYLEKIINHSFYLPKVKGPALQNFIKEQLSSTLIDPTIQGDSSTLSTHVYQVLFSCNFSNPRRVKRIINKYTTLLSGLGAEFMSFDHQVLIKLLILSEFFPKVIRVLYTDPNALLILREVSDNYNSLKLQNKFGSEFANDLLQKSKSLLNFPSNLNHHDIVRHLDAIFNVSSPF